MNRILFILSLCFFIACGNGDEIPPDVLPKEKMVKVLTRMHLAEAAQQIEKGQLLAPGDSIGLSDVFKKEQVSWTQFNKSLQFYSAHPALLDQVYDEVIQELTRMQQDELKKK